MFQEISENIPGDLAARIPSEILERMPGRVRKGMSIKVIKLRKERKKNFADTF